MLYPLCKLSLIRLWRRSGGGKESGGLGLITNIQIVQHIKKPMKQLYCFILNISTKYANMGIKIFIFKVNVLKKIKYK
jgi:hypothetical protein